MDDSSCVIMYDILPMVFWATLHLLAQLNWTGEQGNKFNLIHVLYPSIQKIVCYVSLIFLLVIDIMSAGCFTSLLSLESFWVPYIIQLSRCVTLIAIGLNCLYF